MTTLSHGLHKSKEYTCWQNIKKRCLNKNCKAYENYGGRGITICDEWKNSFATFYKDMGAKPDPSFTIERLDNDLGYSKSNCKWASKKEQASNRRTNRIIVYNGQDTTLQYWADKFGVRHDNIHQHLKTKTIEEVIMHYENK